MSATNILCDPETQNVAGVVDWGDARVGDGDYDLVPIHLSLFGCDSALMRQLSAELHPDSARVGAWMTRQWRRKMMRYTLMWEFEDAAIMALDRGWHDRIGHCRDWDEVADVVWAVHHPI
jgi:aminoglycoside phosphotransferase (APT) family kinase protein